MRHNGIFRKLKYHVPIPSINCHYPKTILKMKKPFLFIFYLLLLATSCQQTQVAEVDIHHGLSAERLAVYEDFLKSEIKEQHIPGAVSLILRNDQITHQKAFGLSSLKNDTPMSGDNIFYIQSMTKPIITVGFMMLYEEGHFFLDDPVSTYLPKFKDLQVIIDPETGIDGATEPLNKPITIAHLLNHTAGFSHGLGSTKLDQQYRQAMYEEQHATIQDRMNEMLGLPLYGQPGEQWYYSASPDVISVLIEYFSGMSTEQFLKERIFDPMGMDDTGYNVPVEKQNRIVVLHTVDDNGKLIESERQPSMSGNTIFSGVNGLWSTASDYLKFSQMMLNFGTLDGRRYLSRKTVEIMTQNHVGNLMGDGLGFGLGFGVTTNVADTKSLGSEGTFYWGGAFCTYFFIDPKEQMVAILMTQLQPYSRFYSKKFRQLVYQSVND